MKCCDRDDPLPVRMMINIGDRDFSDLLLSQREKKVVLGYLRKTAIAVALTICNSSYGFVSASVATAAWHAANGGYTRVE